MTEDKRKKDKQEDLLRAGIAGASYETVQKYGSAAKEHLVGLSGVDNETGARLQKSLKSIQAQGTNDEYAFAIRQQKAGWTAEVKDTATSNAENIIAGKSNRKIRHDDRDNDDRKSADYACAEGIVKRRALKSFDYHICKGLRSTCRGKKSGESDSDLNCREKLARIFGQLNNLLCFLVAVFSHLFYFVIVEGYYRYFTHCKKCVD